MAAQNDQESQQCLPKPSRSDRFKTFWSSDVDKEDVFWPLLAYTAIAGWASAISWCATLSTFASFQSANSLQIGLALGNLMVHGSDPTPHSFHVNQKQAVTSVLTFFVGGLLAQIRPRSWGPTHRGMLVVMTLIQSLLTVFAAICSHVGGQPSFAAGQMQPSWTNASGFLALSFLSASCGLQGVISDKIGSNLGVTVVLTSLWVNLAGLPMTLWKRNKKRDQKFAGVLIMIVGGIVGRSLVGSAGNVVALAALAGLRVLLAVSFFICRTDAPVPSLDITPASSSPPPTRNVSALDFSRFSTITLTEPPSALAQSHTKPLQQVDTITSVQ